MNVLRGIQPKSVEVELVNPICCVGKEELTNGLRVFTVEVNCFSPVGLVMRSEIVGSERLQEITVGANVVIYDVENDSEILSVGLIHKPPQIVRLAIKPRGGEEVDAVVAPAESSGEIGDGHDLENRDPHRRKFL